MLPGLSNGEYQDKPWLGDGKGVRDRHVCNDGPIRSEDKPALSEALGPLTWPRVISQSHTPKGLRSAASSTLSRDAAQTKQVENGSTESAVRSVRHVPPWEVKRKG